MKFTEECIEGNDLAASLMAYIAFKYDGRKKKPEKEEPKPEPFMEVEKVLVRKLGCRCDPPCTSYLSMNCYLVLIMTPMAQSLSTYVVLMEPFLVTNKSTKIGFYLIAVTLCVVRNNEYYSTDSETRRITRTNSTGLKSLQLYKAMCRKMSLGLFKCIV